MTEYGNNQSGTPSASGAPQAPAGYQPVQQQGSAQYGQAGGYASGTDQVGHTVPFGAAPGSSFANDATYGAGSSYGSGSGVYGSGGSGGSGSSGGSGNGGASGSSGGKKTGGAKTFLLGFAGAAVACVIALGGFAVWQNVAGSGSSTQLGSATSTTIDVNGEDTTLAEAVAAEVPALRGGHRRVHGAVLHVGHVRHARLRLGLRRRSPRPRSAAAWSSPRTATSSRTTTWSRAPTPSR